jgi:hypothetical protein
MTRRPAIHERQVFSVELAHLVRTVVTRNGQTYHHRCSLASYDEVIRHIEEHAGVTTPMLWEALPDVPCTQASVAVAFLKERGCLIMRNRHLFPSSSFFYEDALTEFHALAEELADLVKDAQAAQRDGNWNQAAAL